MTLPAEIVTLNFFGGGEPTCFYTMLWRFDSRSKWCTHVSSRVTILFSKVLGSACRWPRSSQMSARHFFCSAVNIRGTQRAETFLHTQMFSNNSMCGAGTYASGLIYVRDGQTSVVIQKFLYSMDAFSGSSIVRTSWPGFIGRAVLILSPYHVWIRQSTLYEGEFSPNVLSISGWISLPNIPFKKTNIL